MTMSTLLDFLDETKIITTAEARDLGFVVLAGPYDLSLTDDVIMLQRVEDDMRRGAIPHARVRVAPTIVEVWRSADTMLSTSKPKVSPAWATAQ